jgi:hypothetical protein
MKSENTSPIVNTSTYTEGMSKSLLDKIYFIDKCDAGLFIDFGCADGFVIKHLSAMFPNITFIGYDVCDKMLKLATQHNPDEIIFTNDINVIQSLVDNAESRGIKTCTILNSVIHEVYSYSNPDEFWSTLFSINTDYIAIRDMCVSKFVNRASNDIHAAKVRQRSDYKQLTEWEDKWGSISNNKSLVHYLLTYKYTDNWDRELNENYLPVYYEDLIRLFPVNKYSPIFVSHYTLPYLRSTVYSDFGIDIIDSTHIKLIFERV